MSRPTSSCPHGCAWLGGAITSAAVAVIRSYGSYGAITGANTAISTDETSMNSPTTPCQFRRKFCQKLPAGPAPPPLSFALAPLLPTP